MLNFLCILPWIRFVSLMVLLGCLLLHELLRFQAMMFLEVLLFDVVAKLRLPAFPLLSFDLKLAI